MNVSFYNVSKLYPDFQKTPGYQTLNADQKKFFKHFFSGENILLTGQAGTGKSYCIELLFNFMQTKGVFVGKTALTGVAALNIGGSTIHSWAGMGLADEDVKSVVDNAMKNKKAKERVRNTHILFVDEISMASADLLEKLDAVLQNIRLNRKPFGGLQVIFSGDFLQLPPVFKGSGEKQLFAFQSKTWDKADVQIVELEKLIRQDDTTPFAKLLQRVRYGDTEDLAILADRIDAELKGDADPIKIFCKNIDIDAYNLSKYRSLTGSEQVYVCKDGGDERYIKNFDRNCQAPPILRLKIGAQVMLLVNLETEAGLVNGAIGKVTAFSPLGPVVKFDNGEKAVIETHKWEIKEQELDLTGRMRYKVVATRSQVPLRLAWATSVHKQQGATISRAVVDLSNAFEFGQVYVALSRVRSIEGLSLADFSPHKIKAHPECLEFYKKHKKKK